ncbi:hypothetical protein SAMN05421766_103770 [Zobellia uliginosa]|uniref:Glyoxalase n=2 Tax=Zobellia uliginosa TaxID=143224 RepID=A0ABY1KT99_9FLAO|nr:hypothetical protein SAMN05421766_103770 [Zobellia uliginosa]
MSIFIKSYIMSDRSDSLSSIRTEIQSAKVTDGMSENERFQNLTLRPIIKFQNDLLVAVFKNYIKKHKNAFYELSLEKRFDYIENAIQKDIKFRNSLKGMVIGHFTLSEYEIYTQNSSALNKRMMNMVITRLKDHIQLFEAPVLVQ